MATFKEAYEAWIRFETGFEKHVEGIIVDNKEEFVDYIQEQLYSGVDGDGKSLTPTYLTDPFFTSPESGRWKNNGKGYAKWKNEITTPTPSYLGYHKRNIYIPNLIIRGDFYDSITAIPIDKGIRIFSRGVDFAQDIESKYGSQIFKVSPKAKEYFYKYFLKKGLEEYYNKFKK